MTTDLPPMPPSAGIAPAPGTYPPPEQPMAAIEKSHSNDVLCGRGVTTNRHPGNEKFRALVTCNKELYVSSTKRQKMTISRSIVEAVRARKPPGRFLEKDVETGLWFDIGDKKAIEKTSQALRDGAASLRKQLSEDMSDPDFLDAVFDGVDPSDAGGARGKPSVAKKSKPPVKKGHRRTNSSPAVTGRANSVKRKQTSAEKAALTAALFPGLSSSDAESQKAALKRMSEASSGASSAPLRPDRRPVTHQHKRTASAGAVPSVGLFSRETEPGSPYPRQTPPTSPNPYMRGSPPASPYGAYACLSLPTSPFPYHCPPTPPSPHNYGYARSNSWDHQAPAPHKRNFSDPVRMNTPSPIGQRSFQEDYPMAPPSPMAPLSPTIIIRRTPPMHSPRKSYQGWPPTSPRSYHGHPPSPRPHGHPPSPRPHGHPPSPRPPHPPSPRSPRQPPPHHPHSPRQSALPPPPPPPPRSPYQQHYHPNISPRYGNQSPISCASPRQDQACGGGRPGGLTIPMLGQESFDRSDSNNEVRRNRRSWANPVSPRSSERPPIHTQSSWSHPPPDHPDTASCSDQHRPSPRSMLRPARLRDENSQDPAVPISCQSSESAQEVRHESGINKPRRQDTENRAPRRPLSDNGSFDTDDHPPDEIRKSFTFIDGQLVENDTVVNGPSSNLNEPPMAENPKVTPSPSNSPEAVQAVESFQMQGVDKTIDFGPAGFHPSCDRNSSPILNVETNDPAMDTDILDDRSFSPLPFDHDDLSGEEPLLGLNADQVFCLSPSISSSPPRR